MVRLVSGIGRGESGEGASHSSGAPQQTVNRLTELVHHEVVRRRSLPADGATSVQCEDFGGRLSRWGYHVGHHVDWSEPCDGATAGLCRISESDEVPEHVCSVSSSTLLVLVDHLWEWGIRQPRLSDRDVLVVWFLPAEFPMDMAALGADVAQDGDRKFPPGTVVSVGMRMLDLDYSGRPFAYTDDPEGVDALNPIRRSVEEALGMFPGVFRGKKTLRAPRNSRPAQDWAWGNPLLCFHELPQFS